MHEPVVAAAPRAATRKKQSQELDADGNPIAKDDDDDEDEQANMSLAAMEAALKAAVLETLELIARDFAQLSEMQDSRMSATLNEDVVLDKQTKQVSETAVRNC